MRRIKSVRNHRLVWVFLFSLICVWVNVGINGHLHRDANGLFVFHAHPYQNTTQQGNGTAHPHSAIDLLYYYLITVLLELCLIVILFFLHTALERRITESHDRDVCFKLFVLIPSLRAPPCA